MVRGSEPGYLQQLCRRLFAAEDRSIVEEQRASIVRDKMGPAWRRCTAHGVAPSAGTAMEAAGGSVDCTAEVPSTAGRHPERVVEQREDREVTGRLGVMAGLRQARTKW